MGEPSSFWARLRRARVLQVLAVYLGASWLVVQISHTLVDALTLPTWVTPVAIILLLVVAVTGPAGERARLELGWLEAEAGRPAEALRHFRAALRSFTRASALYGAARMHEELGEPEEARPYWASLVTLTEQGDDLPRIGEARQAVARAVQEPR